MSEYYQPPFTMTEEITNLVIDIGEQVGAVVTYDSLKPNPTLRRESRIRSIHSSLAIEQNTLTLEQVSDVLCSGVDFSTLYMDETVKNASAGQVLYISL